MKDVKEGYIPVEDGRIWYRIVETDKPGVPLLCLHGGPGACHDYLETLEDFSFERPVVFYDQMGCGNSERPLDPEHWRIEKFVEELGEVRKALGLSQVHILGQSWGTMLAVDYYFIGNPEGIVSMILSGPVMSYRIFMEDQRKALSEMTEEQQRIIFETEARGDFENPEYQDVMMIFYKEHVCRLEDWPDCLNRSFEKIEHGVYEYMQGPSEFTVTGTLKDYDRLDDLKDISVPVLYTCGEFDECTPSSTELFHRLTLNSECIVFKDASHEHHLEKREEYLEKVGDFIRRAERR